MTKTKYPDIYAALLSVYEAVEYIQKTKTGPATMGAYKYAGEADVIAAIRPAMVEAGIVVYPLGISIVSQEERIGEAKASKYPGSEPKPPSVSTHVLALYTFRFAHDSGTFIDACALGEGLDVGDKAAYKAATGAFKYALRQTFCVEVGNDPDDKPSDQIRAEVQQKQAAIAPVIAAPLQMNSDRYKLMMGWVEAAETVDGLKEKWTTIKNNTDAIKQWDAPKWDALKQYTEQRLAELRQKEEFTPAAPESPAVAKATLPKPKGPELKPKPLANSNPKPLVYDLPIPQDIPPPNPSDYPIDDGIPF